MIQKILSNIFSTEKNKGISEPEEKTPIDINTPVTNTRLHSAMLKLKSDTSDAAKDELLAELNKANYLVPIFTDEMRTSESETVGQATIEKGSLIKVLNITDQQGNMYLPIFTDWDALKKHISENVSALVFTPTDTWHWVLSMGDYEGAVINPAENALQLNKGQIQYLQNEATKDSPPK